MPRHLIHGRVCLNPLCNSGGNGGPAPIAPDRPESAHYCDSSCRAEASKIRARDDLSPEAIEALRTAKAGPRSRRDNTSYYVLRTDGLGSYWLIGAASARKRERAIAKVTELQADPPDGHSFVAIPARSMIEYDRDGWPFQP